VNHPVFLLVALVLPAVGCNRSAEDSPADAAAAADLAVPDLTILATPDMSRDAASPPDLLLPDRVEGCPERAATPVDGGCSPQSVAAPLCAVANTADFWAANPFPVHSLYAHFWIAPDTHDLWASTDLGQVVRWNCGATTVLDTGQQGGVRSLWGTSSTDVFIASAGSILHYDGVGWSLSRAAPDNRAAIFKIWGFGPTDVWAVGDSILHYDGQTWSEVMPRAEMEITAFDIWGSASGDVWVVGYGGSNWSINPVLHFHDGCWTRHYLGLPFTHLWGSSAADVWASCPWGLYHWDGVMWAKMHDGELDGLWGTGCNDVWSVGRVGGPDGFDRTPLVVHWDGATIQTTSNDALALPKDVVLEANELQTVWGGGPKDVWITGQTNRPHLQIDALVLHWDGASWFNVPAK
jgi:hypothetical protein